MLQRKNNLVAWGLLSFAFLISLREFKTFKNLSAYIISGSEPVIEQAEEIQEGPENIEDIKPAWGIQQRSISVMCGDTLSSILREIGISFKDIDEIGKAFSKIHNVKGLQIGQIIDLEWDKRPEQSVLIKLETVDSFGNKIVLKRDATRGYDVSLHKRILETYLKAEMGIIRTNFSHAAQQQGIPSSIIQEVIRAMTPILSIKNVRPNTTFEVVFEEKRDVTTGKLVGKKVLKYAAVQTNGKMYKVYSYGNRYYNERGECLKTEFLITPFKNKSVRISSRFGYRTHPILGVVKKHYGIDYAAQYGTEVCAAANGVVKAAGRNGAYGLYVRIRHANGFETAYGHLSAILVRKGDHVMQGERIGRVGSTGRATGPHLHHEVIRHQVPVDPQKYHSLGVSKLSGKDLVQFRHFQAKIDATLQAHQEEAQSTETLKV